MKEFGLQAFSVRDHLDTKENLAATFKELAAMGYSSIHSAVIHHYPAEFLKQAADEAGLIFCGTHYPWDRVLNDVELTIAEHEILGTKNIGIGGMPRPMRTFEGYSEFIETYGPAVEKIRKAGRIGNRSGFPFCQHGIQRIRCGNAVGF